MLLAGTKSTAGLQPDTQSHVPTETADEHTASAAYAARFSGATGRWFLEVQTAALQKLVSSGTQELLDIGGGHGQVLPPLLPRLKQPMVLASSRTALLQIDAFVARKQIKVVFAELGKLPFASTSIETLSCFRLLPHTSDWQALIAELCRVARCAVVVEFPLQQSFNLLAPLLFPLKKRVEGNTRSYQCFTMQQITAEFAKQGFELKGSIRQYFFPMALHRALKAQAISKLMERAAAMLGLSTRFGSPVVARFERVGNIP
jgi:hypothetical protein